MINISQKDRSFLLLVIICFIILWLMTSLFVRLYEKAAFKSSEINKIVAVEKSKWLNVLQPLKIDDLNGKITILHFWNASCIDCIDAINKLKDLNDRFPNSFAIIGVHIPVFENEKNLNIVKKAIIKYDINYPVINDKNHELLNKFKITKSPTFLIFNINGKLKQNFDGKNAEKNAIELATKLYFKNKFSLSNHQIPVVLEKDSSISNILSVPSKIIYVDKFAFKNRIIPAIIIANSGQNSIIVTNLSGEIIVKIGNGHRGFVDDDLINSRFYNPQSIVYHDKKIYVADTGNNSLRLIDLENNIVKTLLGNGSKGDIFAKKKTVVMGNDTNLSLPNDLEFYPDKSMLAISNAGTNQILGYDIKNKNIIILAGNGEHDELDGVYPNNSLKQINDMAVDGDKLYLIDGLTSSIRVLNRDGFLKTLYNGKSPSNITKLQNPRAIIADETGIYISDSLNHAIKKFDYNSLQITKLFGGERGDKIGDFTTFDEPNGIFGIIDKFFIADSGNNRIIEVNRASGKSRLLDIMPTQKLPKEAFVEYLPNLQKSPDIVLKPNHEINLEIKLEQGWKINTFGPSFINLLKIKDEQNADLVANFDWNSINSKKIIFPKLENEQQYLLQGKIYFCRDSINSLCYIKSYEQKIFTNEDSKVSELTIEIYK